MHRLRLLLLTLLCWLTVNAYSAPLPIANEALLHSARLWEAKEREDLALLALQKLVAARPDSPDALLELGELALRMGNVTVASQALLQLQTRFANSGQALAMSTTYRIATRDRLQLASAQRLLQLDRSNEAQRLLKQLFPDGAPDGYLSIEYYQLLARLPGTWERVRAALTRLANDRADDPRYQLALAKHLLKRDETNAAGLAMLKSLSARPDIRRSDVDNALIIALKDLGEQRAPIELIRDYVNRHPEDSDAVALLRRTQTFQTLNNRWWQALLQHTADAYQTSTDAQRLQQWQTGSDAAAQAAQTLFWLDRLSQPLKSTAQRRSDASIEAEVQVWRAHAREALRAGDAPVALLAAHVAKALRARRFEDLIELSPALDAHDAAQTDALLRQAARWAPNSAWLQEVVMRRLVARDPDAALTWLDTNSKSSRLATEQLRSLRAAALKQRGEQALTRTDTVAALRDWQAALAITPDDVWLRYRLANLLLDKQDSTSSDALIQAGLTRQPQDVTMRYAAALYWSGRAQTQTALALLETLPTRERNDDVHALMARLTRTQQRERIDALIAEGRDADALAMLTALTADQPNERGLQQWRAALLMRVQQPLAAVEVLSPLVASDPSDVDTRLEYVRALTEAGQHELATMQLRVAADQLPSMPVGLQLSLARRASALDQPMLTQQASDAVLATQPDNNEAMLLKVRSWQAMQQSRRARDWLRSLPSSARTNPELAALAQQLEAATQATWQSALLIRDKPGDDGISSYHSQILANAWSRPLSDVSTVTLRADVHQLTAGSLPADFRRSDLGTGYLNANTPLIGSQQTQRGLALATVYQWRDWQIDVGTTPLGFTLQHLVGGIAWQPKLKQWDVSLGLERRAITSSVLSFAGLRDPFSGTRWGGVIATGPVLSMGLYQPDFSVSGGFKLQQLNGYAVRRNQQAILRVSGERRMLASDEQALWMGLSVQAWRFAHNLQYYTLGHGGYYSPQSYVSVALPVEWLGAWHKLSYQLRASVSFSRSRSDSMDYFPNDAQLQQQADAQALLNNDDAAHFTGGSGRGSGMAAVARAEYPVQQAWIVGATVAMDRSDYYRPVEYALYLRYGFNGIARTLRPPQGLRPYND